MPMFSISESLLPDMKHFEAMNREIAALLPKDFSEAAELVKNPAAGFAAYSAVTLSIAGHTLDMWHRRHVEGSSSAARCVRRMSFTVTGEATTVSAVGVDMPYSSGVGEAVELLARYCRARCGSKHLARERPSRSQRFRPTPKYCRMPAETDQPVLRTMGDDDAARVYRTA